MDAFAKLADPGFIEDAAFIVSGYGAAAMGDIAVDSALDRDVPNELLGLGVAVGAQYTPGIGGMQMRHAQLGGVAYAGLAAADRIGVRENVEEAL
ncbi:MAG: hypothetical protein ACI8XM_000238 [Haloarculaceae archaeon]|jgi:hypothetical protein